MTDDDLKEALKASNKSKTEKMNELEESLEAHEARQYLAGFTDGDPEDFEETSDDVVMELARVAQENGHRQNTYPIDDELQGAINGNVASSSREEWERRKNGDS